MAFSSDELSLYHERGWLLKRGLFPQTMIDRLSDEIDGLHDRMAVDAPADVGVAWEDEVGQAGAKRIRQLMNSERVSTTLDAISRSDEVLSVMAQLIGPEVFLFHSKLLMKAKRDGTFTPWHQDWGYWHRGFREPAQVNCMLAIDAADEENGAIRFVSGSHKQGLIEHQSIKSNAFSICLPGDLDAYDSELCVMQPGDAVFFGPLVIHASAPNLSDRDRRANTMAFDKPGNRMGEEYAGDRRRL